MYTSQFCAKFFGALLLICLSAQYVSAADGFPKNTQVPTAAWSSTLALTYADDFSATVVSNTYWTASGTTPVLTAAASPAPSFYTVPVTDPSGTANTAVTPQTIAQTTAMSTGSLGIRIITRVKFTSDAGTSLLPVVGVGFKEAAAATQPKTYYAVIEGKSASGTTADKFTQKVGYNDPSLASGSQAVLQSQTTFDAVADYVIVSIDIKPTNLTWGSYDSTKANTALPYFTSVGTPVTSVTPYSSGNVFIGGGSATSATASASATVLSAVVDWIGIYTYQAASASGSSAASNLQYSVVSVILSLLFFAIYLQ